MKAAPEAQAALLTLVELDNKAKAVETKKKTLPEHEELRHLNTERLALTDQITKGETQSSDTETEIKRLEDDLSVAQTRLARNQQRIDDGVVNDARSITTLQEENQHLVTRISDLEDQQLELMVSLEDRRQEVELGITTKGEIERQMRTLLASRDEAVQTADSELAHLAANRSQAISTIPADLATLYEKLAGRMTDAAAKLQSGRCSGCGLMLDALGQRAAEEADADEVIRCPECGRILVRLL